jgi:hypothetical protein
MLGISGSYLTLAKEPRQAARVYGERVNYGLLLITKEEERGIRNKPELGSLRHETDFRL